MRFETDMIRGDVALYSDDAIYRYILSRLLTEEPGLFSTLRPPIVPALLCGFNPSTAGAVENDPTIRREIDFVKRWGANLLIKVNIFAFVSPDPFHGETVDDPVGPENDQFIRDAIEYVKRSNGLFVACWGVPKGGPNLRQAFHARASFIRTLAPWKALKLTKDGHPQHPLYLPADTMLVDFGI